MRRIDVSCRLKPYKASELIFSCMRSKLAYMSPKELGASLKNKNTWECTSAVCNPVLKRDVDRMFGTIRHEPIFYDGLDGNKKRDAQGFTIWNDNTIYVSYRGTCDIMDVLDNIDIRHTRIHKNIRVHKGFFEQFSSIEEGITRDIKRISAEYPIERLVFTGHSLGTSLATISAPYYGAMFKDRFRIISHSLAGAPCGNIDFVNWFSSNVDENVRLEAEGDIVPYIPIHDNFYHVPNGILMKRDGSFVDQYDIKPYSYVKILAMLLNRKGWEQINYDHSCENYITKLFSVGGGVPKE